MKQKFHVGDVVRVAKDLGSTMRHFTNDCYAVVEYSYFDKFPEHNPNEQHKHEYSLLLLTDGGAHSSAWYHSHQLRMVRKNTALSVS